MHHPFAFSFGTRTRVAAAVLAGSVVALLVACAEPSSSPTDVSGHTAKVTEPAAIASVGDDLGKLRAVTAKFHAFDGSIDATYGAQITGCMTDPRLGGMGFHYGKGSAIDGTVNPLEPEVLLYEPQENGKLTLVAVEFVVPYDFAPREGPAPVAFGQQFKQFDDFKLWGLHAWIWKNNPAGMFADWNPNVNCDAVPAAARMSHGSHGS
ncbi:MAG TPA: hypothetical protein VM076_17180 [Gemmatimonadaceae bacterium]|nr:hypothetical protein [Gemmatimonadaceae bacterium]